MVLDLFQAMVDCVSRCVLKMLACRKDAFKHNRIHSGMREPLACRSASAKNAMACPGSSVGPSKERQTVDEQSRSYLAFFRALPASTWGHYTQTLIFTVTWGHPKTLKNASFHVL